MNRYETGFIYGSFRHMYLKKKVAKYEEAKKKDHNILGTHNHVAHEPGNETTLAGHDKPAKAK